MDNIKSSNKLNIHGGYHGALPYGYITDENIMYIVERLGKIATPEMKKTLHELFTDNEPLDNKKDNKLSYVAFQRYFSDSYTALKAVDMSLNKIPREAVLAISLRNDIRLNVVPVNMYQDYIELAECQSTDQYFDKEDTINAVGTFTLRYNDIVTCGKTHFTE